jgi:hypothetical protein
MTLLRGSFRARLDKIRRVNGIEEAFLKIRRCRTRRGVIGAVAKGHLAGLVVGWRDW